MSEMPPPSDLGTTQHAALAAAMAADKDARTPQSTGRVLAELLYGYVLLDSTIATDGRPGVRVITDDDGASGITIFTSNAAFHAARPGSEDVTVMVIPSTEALAMITHTNLDFLLINSGHSMMKFTRPNVEFAAQGPNHVRLRTALALPTDQADAAVLDVLAHPDADDELWLAAFPESIGPNGDTSRMVLRAATNAEGNRVLLAFTSRTEAMLGSPDGVYLTQPVPSVRQIATGPTPDGAPLNGVLLNAGTQQHVVMGDELRAMIAGEAN